MSEINNINVKIKEDANVNKQYVYDVFQLFTIQTNMAWRHRVLLRDVPMYDQGQPANNITEW